MKILVCVDGSQQSNKALEQAALIASGVELEDLAVIHVYESKVDFSSLPSLDNVTQKDVEKLWALMDERKEKSKSIVDNAVELLQAKNLKARGILEPGHPSHTVVETAQEGEFDLIVIGSRGLSGLKRAFLGSVSNSVVQELKSGSVLVVR